MNVYVTQGHEKGIGLEAFFKSCILLPSPLLKKVILIAYKKSVVKTLESMGLPFTIYDHFIDLSGTRISTQWPSKVNISESFTALTEGMGLAEKNGVLFTLPTSKDQFPGFSGHTEYFRDYYRLPELGMFFSSPSLKVLLLTDHLPVAALSKSLSGPFIVSKLKLAIKSLHQLGHDTKNIYVSGLNPHAGEGGLIGSEEKIISNSIKKIQSLYSLNISGPHPADSMIFKQKSSQDIFCYLFHDQGLGVFKALQGFVGSNITLGLPYPRFSPDHGTSFNLFGKNSADYRGCFYSLNEAIKLTERK